jgi:hypothetical protein
MKTKEKIRRQRKIDRNLETKFGDTFLEEYPVAERLGTSRADETTDGLIAGDPFDPVDRGKELYNKDTPSLYYSARNGSFLVGSRSAEVSLITPDSSV